MHSLMAWLLAFNTLRAWGRTMILGLFAIGPLIAVTSMASGEEAAQYVIKPQETLNLRVGQFDAATQEYFRWDGVSGEYRVSPSGSLSVPLLGQVMAAGQTPEKLSQILTELLNRRVGLEGLADVTVDVAAFKDIFVTGAVEAPGAYPWAPGLTALQAISLAGGVERTSGILLQSKRSAIGSQGQYQLLQMNLLAQLASEARLEAELNGADTIQTPPRLEENPLGDELMKREREIKKARDAALDSSLAQISSLETLLQQQISRLTEQLKLRERQLGLAREERATAIDLFERGLSTAARRSSLERLVTDQEVRMLELETARLTAEQRLNEAGRDRLDLTNERQRDLATSIRDTRVDIENTQLRLQTEAALFAEATKTGDGIVMPGSGGEPVIEITRRTDQGTVSLTATRTTEIQPDDVIEVALPGLDSVRVVPLEQSAAPPDTAASPMDAPPD